MVYVLDPKLYGAIQPIFSGLETFLSVQSVLAGASQAEIYADHPSHPQSAMIHSGHHFFLAGIEDNAQFNRDLRSLFFEQIYPHAQRDGIVEFGVFYSSAGWEKRIDGILLGKNPIKAWRQYYALHKLRCEWRNLIPPGFELRQVNRDLLDCDRWKNIDRLREETMSERSNVAEFLGKSFGYCLICGDELAGWCLSEYNLGDRCEIGIETIGKYQRRGVATVTACAVIEEALSRGITEIGWHCYTSNAASAATALRVGFQKVRDYHSYFAWFDEVANLAVNGNVCLHQGSYSEALAWFDRAFQAGDPPTWALLSAAGARTMCGDKVAALSYLRQAIEKGFDDLEYLNRAPYLQGLHDEIEWQHFQERLQS